MKCDYKYKKAFDNNHTAMIILDAKTGNIDDVNLAACNYYGYPKDEFLTKNIIDINISEQEELHKAIDKAREGEGNYFRFKHRISCGEIRNVEVHSGPIEVNSKELLFSVIHDTEDKIQLKKDYAINKAHFVNLFNNSPEAIVIVDRDFKVLNINKSFEKIFMYNLQEIENKDLTELLCEKDYYSISHKFRAAIIKGKFIKEETKRRRKDGGILDVLLLGFPLVMKRKTIGAYCIYYDISEAKKQEKQIQALIRNDNLTGLYNRDFFLHNLEYEVFMKYADENIEKNLAIFIIGINEFREIKDALGHLAGDELLRKFAQRLRTYIEDRGIVSRFEEDEFAILIPKISNFEETIKLSNEIIGNLDPNFTIGNDDFKITTSMGVAIYPDDGMDSNSLLRKAEIAMNKSRKINTNSAIRFENSLDLEVQEYFWMKNDLVKATSNGEFFLNYQPIYDINTSRLVGVEALIRWNHGTRGLISPSKFIPIAEKSGMIHCIGEWVLLNACIQNRRWQDLGYDPIYISVNISIAQLEQHDFLKKVKTILKKSRLSPKYLQLEITETYFTQNYKSIQDTVAELSKLGIKLAIDDFGTGYSSLGHLCEININSLKIDRSFIDGVDKNPNKSKIVKAVISLAESLNISLTAEGVETLEQLSFLKENRCDTVQGYLMSKPVQTKEIERLLTRHKKEI